MKPVTGIGIDVVDIVVFRDLIKKNTHSWKTYFSKQEINYCQNKSDPAPHFAVRFAAKEAAMKAFSRFNIPLKFTEVKVIMEKIYPEIRIENKDVSFMTCELSLTHTQNVAIAVVVVSK